MPYGIAHHIGTLPPVSSLFAAVLGVIPLRHLLTAGHALAALPAGAQRTLTGREYFPHLISGPFQHGLMVVFVAATSLAGVAALASMLRGGRYIHPEVAAQVLSDPAGSGQSGVLHIGGGNAVQPPDHCGVGLDEIVEAAVRSGLADFEGDIRSG